MTDLQLVLSYDRTASKCKAMLRAMSREGCSLQEMVTRLERLGKHPQKSLLQVFGTERIELIPPAIIQQYCTANGIPTRQRETAKPERRTGVTTEYCKGCDYFTRDYGEQICNYIIVEGRRRGCPAGDGCKRRRIRGRRK